MFVQQSQTARLLGTISWSETRRVEHTGRSPSLVNLSRVPLSDCRASANCPLHYNSLASGSIRHGFEHRLCPVHSPLLRASRLFSFPALNDMLKFSALSYVAEVSKKGKGQTRNAWIWSLNESRPSKAGWHILTASLNPVRQAACLHCEMQCRAKANEHSATHGRPRR